MIRITFLTKLSEDGNSKCNGVFYHKIPLTPLTVAWNPFSLKNHWFSDSLWRKQFLIFFKGLGNEVNLLWLWLWLVTTSRKVCIWWRYANPVDCKLEYSNIKWTWLSKLLQSFQIAVFCIVLPNPNQWQQDYLFFSFHLLLLISNIIQPQNKHTNL